MRDALVEAIAKALKCDADCFSEASGLGKHPRWDSLGHITIMVTLERDFGIEVNEENVGLLITIADIRACLDARELSGS